jgi:hypothetical protein
MMVGRTKLLDAFNRLKSSQAWQSSINIPHPNLLECTSHARFFQLRRVCDLTRLKWLVAELELVSSALSAHLQPGLWNFSSSDGDVYENYCLKAGY